MFFLLYLLIVVIAAPYVLVTHANIIVNNKTVVCYGGPGTHTDVDTYNNHGNWNRTYLPVEPQQIHITWVSDAKAFRVQFSTKSQVDRSQLHYWPETEYEDTNHFQHDSQGWEFVDGGTGQYSQYMHTFISHRLDPSSTYHYKVSTFHDNVHYLSPIFTFRTPDEESSSFRFLATGDLGVVNTVTMPAFKQMAREREFDFVAIAGDQAYNMHDFNGTKGDEFMNFAQDFYANIPVLTTAGNHESEYNFSHYKNRFNIMPYIESGFPDPLQYSINYKSLHLISFSTEAFFEGSDAQIQTSLNWLEQDLIKANLQRSKRPWIVVFGHRPLYCSAFSNEDCTSHAERLRFGITSQGGLETLLTKYNVDLFVCGHKHNYERTFPVRNNTRLTTSYHNAPSFFQIITGNAGNHEGPDMFDNTTVVPSWLGHQYQGYGFSTFEVGPRQLTLHHYRANIDGSIGLPEDYVRVTKTLSYIHKQKIIKKR